MSTRKLNMLTPEPIHLLEEGGDNSEEFVVDEGCQVQRIYVGDGSITTSDEAKFTIWKVTTELIVHKVEPVRVSIPLEIVSYRRYSEFDQLRAEIISKIGKNVQVPELPPKVYWYDYWRFSKINLNRHWLNKRRQGLDNFINKIIKNKDIMESCAKEVNEFLGVSSDVSTRTNSE
ncbi:hypothetical protein Kpol_530p4 [Vanderwaltozyma polyspora DSM 70294]|uniref:Endosomal/vacuolar adapter protein YPT35 n=1 Tax=Vanderwaltozyma polyspora (strain ATCC 22028 / DSM 70294 / BCRC 21397 / CBS 2163 / NBRC 10782 / NRRL Y-8283 / UCD 57-17) TaxID=436907 RepID=YPT35_VANPO|nr:uncharacterized protein Kpol_530p4 [Vanderwaltozyma polyspora DSM 70294]A7TKX9.1 RecName: Full=Endosomal/vacuolar adapter protein YPT35; AltName: Full=PX domain-containing protein YPT35 [Vanderwaltozyma polyspora DSM 70294]EDO17035.1 hypothetical protein Kpol_530p4 [Vanderwaltozyma polyspora DSM 70294]